MVIKRIQPGRSTETFALLRERLDKWKKRSLNDIFTGNE